MQCVVMGALAGVLALGPACGASASVAEDPDLPCYVVTAPVEQTVVSCHPSPAAQQCTVQLRQHPRSDQASAVQLTRAVAASVEKRNLALNRILPRERPTCPSGRRAANGDCLPG
ncbi:MAG: hypothetical protein ABIJ09_14090 [Pseudomonadota bacterium]